MNFTLFGYDFTLSEFIAIACSLFLSLFYAVKTHGLKNIIKEVLDMMYNFKTLKSVAPDKEKGQTFSKTQPVYRLNKATGELELTDEVVNIQAIIDSCLDTCLDRALDRLLPKVEEQKDIADLELMREDLDVAMQGTVLAEKYKAQYNLDPKMSLEDVFAYVSNQAEILKAKIDTAKQISEEVKDDAQKNVEKSE